MEPSAAIAVIETELRSLVRTVYRARQEPEGWIAALSPDGRAKLEQRRREEAARRKPAAVPHDLLAYTHFYEVRRVLEREWPLFADALGELKEFKVWADQVEDFRNAPAHSRELLPHERALLEGMAGVIRTKVTIFKSTAGPDMNHFPLIESARDSFGNEFEVLATRGYENILHTNMTLEPGQEVRFIARAWDPQGRELTWKMIVQHANLRATAQGTDVELVWVVDESDVGMDCYVDLHVVSNGRFHRHQGFDHKVVFQYRVDPPTE